METTLLAAGIPVTYVAMWILCARQLYRRPDSDFGGELALYLGIFWPAVLLVIPLLLAVKAPSRAERKTRKIQRRADALSQAESDLRDATERLRRLGINT